VTAAVLPACSSWIELQESAALGALAEARRNSPTRDDSRRALPGQPACSRVRPASAPMAATCPGALGHAVRERLSPMNLLSPLLEHAALVAVAMALALRGIKSASAGSGSAAGRLGRPGVLAVWSARSKGRSRSLGGSSGADHRCRVGGLGQGRATSPSTLYALCCPVRGVVTASPFGAQGLKGAAMGPAQPRQAGSGVWSAARPAGADGRGAGWPWCSLIAMARSPGDRVAGRAWAFFLFRALPRSKQRPDPAGRGYGGADGLAGDWAPLPAVTPPARGLGLALCTWPWQPALAGQGLPAAPSLCAMLGRPSPSG